MTIWKIDFLSGKHPKDHKEKTYAHLINHLNEISKNCIHDSLGIQFTVAGDDFLEASMPVDSRTKNPVKILHGGASVVLAESLGSIATALTTGLGKKRVVGIEVNASHLKSATEGTVHARATPIRMGKSLQVWEVRVRAAQALESELVCICRITSVIKDL